MVLKDGRSGVLLTITFFPHTVQPNLPSEYTQGGFLSSLGSVGNSRKHAPDGQAVWRACTHSLAIWLEWTTLWFFLNLEALDVLSTMKVIGKFGFHWCQVHFKSDPNCIFTEQPVKF